MGNAVQDLAAAGVVLAEAKRLVFGHGGFAVRKRIAIAGFPVLVAVCGHRVWAADSGQPRLGALPGSPVVSEMEAADPYLEAYDLRLQQPLDHCGRRGWFVPPSASRSSIVDLTDRSCW